VLVEADLVLPAGAVRAKTCTEQLEAIAPRAYRSERARQ
jgi:hypothetical protein